MRDIKYVNMDTSSSDEAFGRTISLKVSLKIKTSTFVYAFLVPGEKNIDPLKINSSNRGGIGSPGVEKQGVISGSNGVVTFDLIISNYGGDEFTVKVAEDKAGTKGVVELGTSYVVWKKLYYQTSKMKSSFNFPFNKVVDEYKKHFIELQETSSIEVPHKENIETEELKSYNAHFKKDKSPFEAHVVLIDRQCDSRVVYINNTVTKQVVFIEQDFPEWPFSDWLIDADGFDSTGKKGVVKVIKKTVLGKKGIEVDLTGSGLDATKSEVDLDIAYKSLKGEYTGDATYTPNIFIAVGKPRSDASKSKTVSHEIGHGIGMVPTVKHELQYDNINGGMGSHCRHGANPDKKSKAQGGAFTGTYTNGKCVMFAYSSEYYTFCETCAGLVKEAGLSESSMKSRGWG